jgi:hypothetical protein
MQIFILPQTYSYHAIIIIIIITLYYHYYFTV